MTLFGMLTLLLIAKGKPMWAGFALCYRACAGNTGFNL
jgi:hypothetical protein